MISDILTTTEPKKHASPTKNYASDGVLSEMTDMANGLFQKGIAEEDDDFIKRKMRLCRCFAFMLCSYTEIVHAANKGVKNIPTTRNKTGITSKSKKTTSPRMHLFSADHETFMEMWNDFGKPGRKHAQKGQFRLFGKVMPFLKSIQKMGYIVDDTIQAFPCNMNNETFIRNMASLMRSNGMEDYFMERIELAQRLLPPTPQNEENYIYISTVPGYPNLVKIGRSKDPEKRTSENDAFDPSRQKPVLLYVMPAPKKFEKSMHRFLDDLRIKGIRSKEIFMRESLDRLGSKLNLSRYATNEPPGA
jgi:hypothetical protein